MPATQTPVRDQQLLELVCFRWQMVACSGSGSWCIVVLALPATGCTVNAVGIGIICTSGRDAILSMQFLAAVPRGVLTAYVVIAAAGCLCCHAAAACC